MRDTQCLVVCVPVRLGGLTHRQVKVVSLGWNAGRRTALREGFGRAVGAVAGEIRRKGTRRIFSNQLRAAAMKNSSSHISRITILPRGSQPAATTSPRPDSFPLAPIAVSIWLAKPPYSTVVQVHMNWVAVLQSCLQEAGRRPYGSVLVHRLACANVRVRRARFTRSSMPGYSESDGI